MGVALDGFDAFGDVFGGGVAAAEDLGPADDGVERGAQLVAEGGEELVLDAVGAFGFFAGGVGVGQEALAFGFGAAGAEEGVDGGDEDGRLDGVGEVGIGAGFEAFDFIHLLDEGGGEVDDGEAGGVEAFADLAADVEAAHIGKIDVEDDEVDVAHLVEGVLAGGGFDNLEVGGAEHARGGVAAGGVVVDDHDGGAAGRVSVHRLRPPLR